MNASKDLIGVGMPRELWKPLSGDLDGDALTPVKVSKGEIANQAHMSILSAKTFDEALEIFQEEAEYNRSKFKALSKRRKKIFIRHFIHYNVENNKLVHQSRRDELNVRPVPLIMRWEEKYNEPMNNMLNAWIDIISEE